MYGGQKLRALPEQLTDRDRELQSIARATALALGDGGLRRHLQSAVAASRFHEGKLHFQSFLDQYASRAFLHAVATQRGVSAEELLAAARSWPPMELYLPVASQREQWNATADYIVVGTAFNDSQLRRAGRTHIRGWTPQGVPYPVGLRDVPESTLISIVPAEIDFSPQPIVLNEECDPDTVIIECPGDPGGGSSSPTYTGMYIDVLAHRYSPWSYDDVPFGDPEFEVYLAERDPITGTLNSPPDAAGHAPCAGDSHSVDARHFDYNNPPTVYHSDFLVAEGTASWLAQTYGSGDGYVYVVFSENDDTGCPAQAEPSLEEYDNGSTSNDDDLLAAVGFQMGSALPWSWTNPNTGGDPGLFSLNFAANKAY